ncbi:MAG: cupin [Deltaproteobacteria bacterium CG2_30_63_29]|nr:MAG: cupin [Deltaproteobacteria bacterium CG2_30_63_29]PJB43388.1 MAG: cupin [Deltaproteobacteria bacterium CG_4_9_14_3_um_filter_63_12]
MKKIEVQRHPSEAELERLGARGWPIWTKEVSTFPWSYDEREVCFLLEGQVTVTPDDGEPVSFGAGDLVTFQAGLSCTWNVREPVRKHYAFG